MQGPSLLIQEPIGLKGFSDELHFESKQARIAQNNKTSFDNADFYIQCVVHRPYSSFLKLAGKIYAAKFSQQK